MSGALSTYGPVRKILTRFDLGVPYLDEALLIRNAPAPLTSSETESASGGFFLARAQYEPSLRTPGPADPDLDKIGARANPIA